MGFTRKGTRARLLRLTSGSVLIKLYVVRCSNCGTAFFPFHRLTELASHGNRPEEILDRLQSLPVSHFVATDAVVKSEDSGSVSASRGLQVPWQARRLRPFSLIDRHLLKEMAVSFALGLGIFTFVLLMDQMMRLMDLIINKGAPVGVVLRLILYVLPFSFTVTIPMSVLLAVLTTYGRVSSEGEAIVLKASGLSLYRLMAPGVLFGIVATLVTLWISALVQPNSTRALKTLTHQLYHTHVLTALEEGIFNTDYPGLAIYVDRSDKRDGALHGILVIDQRNQADQHLIIAQKGALLSKDDGGETPIGLQLSKGTLHTNSSGNPARYRNLDFETYDLQILTDGTIAETVARVRQSKELNLTELRAEIARLTKDGGKPWPLQVELHKKFALPIACLILSAIGAPLAIRVKKAGRGISFALSVGFAVFYYIQLATGESLGSRGIIEPAVAVWLPNLTFSIIAISLVLTEGREVLLPARLESLIRTLISFPRSAISRQ